MLSAKLLKPIPLQTLWFLSRIGLRCLDTRLSWHYITKTFFKFLQKISSWLNKRNLSHILSFLGRCNQKLHGLLEKWLEEFFRQHLIDCCAKFATGLKCSNRHRSKSMRVTKLFFCQIDPPMSASFWQKNRPVIHELFDLCLFEHFSPVANFAQQSIWSKKATAAISWSCPIFSQSCPQYIFPWVSD